MKIEEPAPAIQNISDYSEKKQNDNASQMEMVANEKEERKSALPAPSTIKTHFDVPNQDDTGIVKIVIEKVETADSQSMPEPVQPETAKQAVQLRRSTRKRRQTAFYSQCDSKTSDCHNSVESGSIAPPALPKKRRRLDEKQQAVRLRRSTRKRRQTRPYLQCNSNSGNQSPPWKRRLIWHPDFRAILQDRPREEHSAADTANNSSDTSWQNQPIVSINAKLRTYNLVPDESAEC